MTLTRRRQGESKSHAGSGRKRPAKTIRIRSRWSSRGSTSLAPHPRREPARTTSDPRQGARIGSRTRCRDNQQTWHQTRDFCTRSHAVQLRGDTLGPPGSQHGEREPSPEAAGNPGIRVSVADGGRAKPCLPPGRGRRWARSSHPVPWLRGVGSPSACEPEAVGDGIAGRDRQGALLTLGVAVHRGACRLAKPWLPRGAAVGWSHAWRPLDGRQPPPQGGAGGSATRVGTGAWKADT